jgi:hypothetical protein
MNGYELRSATNADSDAIKELVFGVLREYRLQPDPDGTDTDLNDIETNYLRSGGCFDVLVDSRGAIIGSVGLYPIDSATCELRKMYLSQQVRRVSDRGHTHSVNSHTIRLCLLPTQRG